MSKNVYIVMSRKFALSRKEMGKWENQELCEFVSKVKDKHIMTSHVILDVRRKSVFKSRDEEKLSYDEYLEHVKEKYPEQVAKLFDMYPDYT